MGQNYIIFHKNKSIEIVWDSHLPDKVRIRLGKRIEKFELRRKVVAEPLKERLIEFEEGAYRKIQLKSGNTKKLFRIVRETYDKELMAGGGVVINKSHQILWIYRNKKWDLPKGKIEEGETILEGSVREVMEETGLEKVRAIMHLLSTYHTYELKGKRIFKETVWYLMRSSSKVLVPQLEEGITKVKWGNPNDIEKMSNNSYKNIQLVLKHLATKVVRY